MSNCKVYLVNFFSIFFFTPKLLKYLKPKKSINFSVMHSDSISKVGKALFILLTLISVFLVSADIYQTQFMSLDPPTPQEKPEIEASYSNETSKLELEVVDGQFTNWKSSQVKISQGDSNFTLEGYGTEKDTNYWAKDRFTLNSAGLTRFPIREGENISFELKNVEPITIKTLDKGEEVNSHNIVFENCEPKVYAEMYLSGNETNINKAGECID